jgi:hypothetical protein
MHNIPYDTVLDLLVGHFKSPEELQIVLNFLDHTKSLLRLLYWSQKFKHESSQEQKHST